MEDHQEVFGLETKTTGTVSRSNTYTFTPYQRPCLVHRINIVISTKNTVHQVSGCETRDAVESGVECQRCRLDRGSTHSAETKRCLNVVCSKNTGQSITHINSRSQIQHIRHDSDFGGRSRIDETGLTGIETCPRFSIVECILIAS